MIGLFDNDEGVDGTDGPGLGLGLVDREKRVQIAARNESLKGSISVDCRSGLVAVRIPSPFCGLILYLIS